MGIFILRRAAEAPATWFVLTFVIFLRARLVGDPVPLSLATEATVLDMQFLRRQVGLDQPLLVQHGNLLGNIIQGDFGNSFRYLFSPLGCCCWHSGPPSSWSAWR